MFCRVAPGPATLAEDPLVVDLSQLPFGFVEYEMGSGWDRAGRRRGRDVDPLSGHMAMRFEAHAVWVETDFDFGDFRKFIGQSLALALNVLPELIVVFDFAEVDDHGRPLGHR